MEKKPYHHLPDGTFRNPEGSPKPDPNVKWSFKIFNKEKFPNSKYLSRYGFYIPSYIDIRKSEMDYVISTINKLI